MDNSITKGRLPKEAAEAMEEDVRRPLRMRHHKFLSFFLKMLHLHLHLVKAQLPLRLTGSDQPFWRRASRVWVEEVMGTVPRCEG